MPAPLTGVLGGTAGGHCDFINPHEDLPESSPTRRRVAASHWRHAAHLDHLDHRLNKEPFIEKPPRPLQEILAELKSLPCDSCEGTEQKLDAAKAALKKMQAALNKQELELLRLQAEVSRKQKVLSVYEGREAELYKQLETKDGEIDLVDDEVDDHARALARREESLEELQDQLDIREASEMEKMAAKQEEWDKRLMFMEKGVEKKKLQLDDLREKLELSGLGGDQDAVQAKFMEEVEKRLAPDMQQLNNINKEMDQCEEEKDALFASMSGPLGKLLKKEIQIRRRDDKMRLVNNIMMDYAHQEHVYIRELAELNGEDPGTLSETDEEQEEIPQVVLPDGWTVEHLVFVKMVKHDKALQRQLTALKEWWGQSKREWSTVDAYIREEWKWDDSQIYFLDADIEATRSRRDDGAFKQLIGKEDLLKVFKVAVIDAGRDVKKWKAFV